MTTKIKELREKHGALTTQVKAWQEEWQGKDEIPEDKAAEVDAMLSDMDRVEAELEAAIASDERRQSIKSRLDSADALSKKSAGLLPGMGGQTTDEDGVEVKSAGGNSIMQVKDGRVGIQTQHGWVNFGSKSDWASPENKRLRAAATTEYKAEFDNFLRGRPFETKVLTEGTDPAGGYLVPPDIVAQVIQRIPGVTVVEGRARTINTTRDQVEIPRVAASSTDSTMYSSAVRFEMVGETPTDTQGATEPVFEMLRVPVFTAKMTTQLSRNLVADSGFDVEGYLADEYMRSGALGKDDKFLTGVGGYEPVGIINDPDLQSGAITTGNASTMTSDGWMNLIYDLPQQYASGAIVVMSRDARKVTAKLKDGSGAYLLDFTGGTGRIGGERPQTILGVPYIISDFLDTVGANNYPAFYGNLQFFWVVNRLQMSVQILREKYAENNENGYLAFLRFTGAVTVPEAFRLHKVAA